MSNYFEPLKKIVADILRVDEKQVTTEANLKELGADSLDIAELLMELEEYFEISIPNEDTAEFLSLKTATDYITARKTETSTEIYGRSNHSNRL